MGGWLRCASLCENALPGSFLRKKSSTPQKYPICANLLLATCAYLEYNKTWLDMLTVFAWRWTG